MTSHNLDNIFSLAEPLAPPRPSSTIYAMPQVIPPQKMKFRVLKTAVKK